MVCGYCLANNRARTHAGSSLDSSRHPPRIEARNFPHTRLSSVTFLPRSNVSMSISTPHIGARRTAYRTFLRSIVLAPFCSLPRVCVSVSLFTLSVRSYSQRSNSNNCCCGGFPCGWWYANISPCEKMRWASQGGHIYPMRFSFLRIFIFFFFLLFVERYPTVNTFQCRSRSHIVAHFGVYIFVASPNVLTLSKANRRN